MDNRKKIIILIVLFTFISLNVDIAFSYSRYMSKNVWNHFLKSKDFYFSSDVLDYSDNIKVNTMWDGGKTKFQLTNEDNGKISKYDINYDLECNIISDNKDDFECLINNDSDKLNHTLSSYQICSNNTGDGVDVSGYSKSDCEMNNYKWNDQTSKKEYYFEILPLTDQPLTDIRVEITASTLKPYKTTISKEFSYHMSNAVNNGILYEFKSDLVFDKLLITNTYNEDKCVSVEWNNNDYRIKTSDTDEQFEDNGYINKVHINIEGKNNKILEFQKKNKLLEGDINAFTISDC